MLGCRRMRKFRDFAISGLPYLVDVLALELRDELVETLVIGVNTNGRENTLDISGRGGSVASEGEEEVGCHVLHFEWFSAST